MFELVGLQSMIVVEELRQAKNGGYSLGPNYSAKPGKTQKISQKSKTPGRAVRQLMRSHGVRREGVRCNLLQGRDGDMFAFTSGKHHLANLPSCSDLHYLLLEFAVCVQRATWNGYHAKEQRITLPKELRPPPGCHGR